MVIPRLSRCVKSDWHNMPGRWTCGKYTFFAGPSIGLRWRYWRRTSAGAKHRYGVGCGRSVCRYCFSINWISVEIYEIYGVRLYRLHRSDVEDYLKRNKPTKVKQIPEIEQVLVRILDGLKPKHFTKATVYIMRNGDHYAEPSRQYMEPSLPPSPVHQRPPAAPLR